MLRDKKNKMASPINVDKFTVSVFFINIYRRSRLSIFINESRVSNTNNVLFFA